MTAAGIPAAFFPFFHVLGTYVYVSQHNGPNQKATFSISLAESNVHTTQFWPKRHHRTFWKVCQWAQIHLACVLCPWPTPSSRSGPGPTYLELTPAPASVDDAGPETALAEPPLGHDEKWGGKSHVSGF